MSAQQYNFLKRNKINILQFTFGPFQENTYVIWSDESKNAYVIDPGMSNPIEEEYFQETLLKYELQLVAIYNTHCHIDHIMGVAYLQKKFQIPFYHHPLEESNIRRSEQMSSLWNIPYTAPLSQGLDLIEGDTWKIDNESIEIIAVPGHCEGHLAFIHHASATIISGDVLFFESIGRADLPGGNMEILGESIDRLYKYPENYMVFSGHGPSTKIEHEKKHNPFFPAR